MDTYATLGWAVACSSVAVWGNATTDGKLIHGHNTDWDAGKALCEAGVTILAIPEKGYPYLLSSWRGIIGNLNGMNAAGITVAQMSQLSKDGYAISGNPVFWISTEVLQYSASIQDAIEIVSGSKRTYGSNLLVTDGKVNDAVVIETSKHRLAVRDPEYVGIPPNPEVETYPDTIWSSFNLYQTPQLAKTQPIVQLLARLIEYGFPKLPFIGDVRGRYNGWTKLLEENYGNIDMECMGRMQKADYPVYDEWSTVTRMVMCPEDLTLRIDNQWFTDPDSERALVEYNLKEILLRMPNCRINGIDAKAFFE